MVSCVINRSGAHVGEAFHVVGEFMGSGVVSKYFADGAIVMLFITFLIRLGYQCFVGHLGITTMAFVLSL